MRFARQQILRLLALVVVLCVLATSCKRSAPEAGAEELASSAARATEPQKQEQQLIVFAAASLREGFTGIAELFERSHPQLELVFNFAGTQALRTQLEHGARADVFASADRRHLDELVRAKHVAEPVVFARNEPVLVVAEESAQTIGGLADLPRANRLVIGTPEVPIGRYTLEIFDRASTTLGADFRARVEAKIVSRELNVRQVLAKVKLGEAEAGIVYRTDVRAAEGGVRVLTLPPEVNVIAEYPIATVMGAAQPELARAWVDFVLSEEGQRVLRDHGFLPPSRGDSEP